MITFEFITLVIACRSSPCKNGATCINIDSGYRCECNPGYSGFNCDTGEYVLSGNKNIKNLEAGKEDYAFH